MIELTKMVITVESEERGESKGEKHSGTVHMRSDSMLQQRMCVNRNTQLGVRSVVRLADRKQWQRQAKAGRKVANMNILYEVRSACE